MTSWSVRSISSSNAHPQASCGSHCTSAKRSCSPHSAINWMKLQRSNWKDAQSRHDCYMEQRKNKRLAARVSKEGHDYINLITNPDEQVTIKSLLDKLTHVREMLELMREPSQYCGSSGKIGEKNETYDLYDRPSTANEFKALMSGLTPRAEIVIFEEMFQVKHFLKGARTPRCHDRGDGISIVLIVEEKAVANKDNPKTKDDAGGQYVIKVFDSTRIEVSETILALKDRGTGPQPLRVSSSGVGEPVQHRTSRKLLQSSVIGGSHGKEKEGTRVFVNLCLSSLDTYLRETIAQWSLRTVKNVPRMTKHGYARTSKAEDLLSVPKADSSDLKAEGPFILVEKVNFVIENMSILSVVGCTAEKLARMVVQRTTVVLKNIHEQGLEISIWVMSCFVRRYWPRRPEKRSKSNLRRWESVIKPFIIDFGGSFSLKKSRQCDAESDTGGRRTAVTPRKNYTFPIPVPVPESISVQIQYFKELVNRDLLKIIETRLELFFAHYSSDDLKDLRNELEQHYHDYDPEGSR